MAFCFTMNSEGLWEDRVIRGRRASSQSLQGSGATMPRCLGVKWHSYTQLVFRGSLFPPHPEYAGADVAVPGSG